MKTNQYRLSSVQSKIIQSFPDNYFPARLISGMAGIFQISSGNTVITAIKTYSDVSPITGDWVAAEYLSDGTCVIREILPRHGVLSRRAPGSGAPQILAVNVDTVCAVVSTGTDFNIHRIERILSLAAGSDCAAAIILTKTDLVDDREPYVSAIRSVCGECSIFTVSVYENEGVADLLSLFDDGETCVLIGASGSGKSTLTAALTGQDVAVGPLSSQTGKGRHTTTTRELFTVGSGTLIDTPGLREIGLDSESDCAAVFPEIERLAGLCKFRNCSHSGEPGCAVLSAIDTGDLDAERLDSFRSLRMEEDFFRLREELGAAGAEKSRWKQIRKVQREMKKKF